MRTNDLIKTLAPLPFHLLAILGAGYAAALGALKPSLGHSWLDFIRSRVSRQRMRISHHNNGNDTPLTFYTPNWICRMRAETFSTKEPETLEWIDQYGGGVFYDIGSNVGLYSIYYAKTKKGSVYAFEPSVFNLGLLSKNIYENGVSEQIRIVPNPLSSSNQFAQFNLSTVEEGGAMSAFGVTYDHCGAELSPVISYMTCGFTLDFLVENGLIPEPPNIVKIDVDGIEHLILAGAKKTLSQPECKTVLIEVNHKFQAQADTVASILQNTGFKLSKQKRSEIVQVPGGENTFNQIWHKG